MLSWRSADPELVVQEVGGPVAGKAVVDVSAGKYRTAVVTAEGDIFMWEGWSKPPEAAGSAARLGGGKDAAPLPAAAFGKSPDAPRCVYCIGRIVLSSLCNQSHSASLYLLPRSIHLVRPITSKCKSAYGLSSMIMQASWGDLGMQPASLSLPLQKETNGSRGWPPLF